MGTTARFAIGRGGVVLGARGLAACLALVALSVWGDGPAQAKERSQGKIVVNGVALTDETVRQLQSVYPVPIPSGRYWYDPVSGAYGREGAPIYGQMAPGLPLGGPLKANASRGGSKVFINGRELTAGEKRYIEAACQTPVSPGRYWVLATGVGGYEGGPAVFNLTSCGQSSRPRGSSTKTFCDANGACTSTGILGYITTAPN